MISTEEIKAIENILSGANHIVVIQADNPDGDSLGSAMALEELLEEQGKQVSLYCGVDMPSYLRYVEGWDRVTKEMPNSFDASIIVDASTKTLLETLEKNNQFGWLSSKPCIVIDHHTSVINGIDFADVSVVDATYASTGDILFDIANKLNWKTTTRMAEMVMVSILGDTQGLSNSLATSNTYRTMAKLIELGVDRPTLEDKRREASKMPYSILLYKADLIKRTQFFLDNKVAVVTIPPKEIKSYSPMYNPAPLIQGDLLQTEGVLMAIAFKYYDDGRITGSIRCNPPLNIADRLAESFGGGGHPYASGFRDTSGVSVEQLQKRCLDRAHELINEIAEI